MGKKGHKNHNKKQNFSQSNYQVKSPKNDNLLKQHKTKELKDVKLAKLALDSLSFKNKEANVESWSPDYRLDETSSDYYDEDDDDDEKDSGSIHFLSPEQDPRQLLNSLTNLSNEHAHFSNSPLIPVTRKSFKYLDKNSEEESSIGPPENVSVKLVKPRFITLSWSAPKNSADDITSYSVFYKMNNNDR